MPDSKAVVTSYDSIQEFVCEAIPAIGHGASATNGQIQQFSDHDQPDAHDKFQKWRVEHPTGWFINCRSSGGWMLHRVTCPHHGTTDWRADEGWGSLTRTPKLCSASIEALIELAKSRRPILLRCNECDASREESDHGKSAR